MLPSSRNYPTLDIFAAKGLLKRIEREGRDRDDFELADGLSDEEIRHIVGVIADQLQRLDSIYNELYDSIPKIPYDGPKPI